MEYSEILFEPILWTYVPLENGECTITLRMTFYKDVKYVPTGISSTLDNWDSVNAVPRASHPKCAAIYKKVEEIKDQAKFLLKLTETQGTPIDNLADLKKRLKKTPVKQIRGAQPKILELFDKTIQELNDAENPGYADVFQATRNKVAKFLNDNDKSFHSFSKIDHERYEAFILKTNPSKSTISFYLRNYYRIWNIAIDTGIITKEQHPSHSVQSKPYGKIKTKKRAIRQDYWQKIMKLEFPMESRYFRSQKYFQFSYYGRGMNFGDMCKLKDKKIRNEDVEYRRSKNHRDYDFRLHPKALEIIEIFKNYPMQSDAGYIFPILMKEHDTARKIDQRIESALKDVNEDLKEFAKMVGYEKNITTYSARHSFATHLRDKKVDFSYIKEALGHELESQTRVYLDEIDDSPIADAVNNALE